MTNWRTNLGGALSVTGSTMVGVGVLTQLTQLSPKTSTILSATQLSTMWWIALIGFLFGCVGKGLAFYFAADAKDVSQKLYELQQRSNEVPNAIASGDTSILRNVPITPVKLPDPSVQPSTKVP